MLTRAMIALLISLGSITPTDGGGGVGGPILVITNSKSLQSYVLTDHIEMKVSQHGGVKLSVIGEQFIISRENTVASSQQIDRLPDLTNTRWTKEWKASDLPIFCKAEHHIQKKSGIAFRFRLGSLDYVNALEGK